MKMQNNTMTDFCDATSNISTEATKYLHVVHCQPGTDILDSICGQWSTIWYTKTGTLQVIRKTKLKLTLHRTNYIIGHFQRDETLNVTKDTTMKQQDQQVPANDPVLARTQHNVNLLLGANVA